jgi:hypothetical protein
MTTLTDGTTPLELEEASRLTELEAIVDRGRQTFVEVGQALAEIRDRRLYRETHPSFEGYLAARWDLSKPYASQLITASETVALATANGLPTPSSERVARELALLREEPDRLHEAWAGTVEQHGQKPTAAQTREVVRGRIPLPTNESVVRRLAATAQHDEQRAYEIWRATVDEHGPGATPEQVGQIAAGFEAFPHVDDAKRCASAIRKAFKHRDARAARQALAIWRAGVYGELDRIARSSS